MVEQFHRSAVASDRDMPVAAQDSRSMWRRALLDTLRAAFGPFLHWQQRRRQRRDLSSLSEELLKDIGLTRRDADKESRKWPWR